MATVTDRRLDRLKEGIGALVETHADGLSRDELRRRYAGAGGTPDLDGFVRFCADMGDVTLTPDQLEGARALVENRQVIIVGANGVGKDTLGALWALYELTVLGAEDILTGPTDRQVHETLMRREIGRYWSRAAGKLRGQRYERAIRQPGAEAADLIAFTATDPDKFQSHHAARLFILVTEGQGIAPEIFEAVQKCQPTKLLVTCNPTTPACAAYGFSRSREWTTLTWSALDHPNVETGETVVPGAVTREWVESVRREHGEASRFWRVAVLAQWPEEADSPLFFAERWNEAVARGPERARRIEREAARFADVPGSIRTASIGERPRAVIAADIAGSGADKTALVVRVGWVIWRLLRWREADSYRNAERIAEEARRLVREGFGVEAIVVDEVGEGRGTYDKLARIVPELKWREYRGGRRVRDYTLTPRLVGFKSSRSAGNSTRFVNARAEAFDTLAQRFEEGDAAVRPDVDRDLLADLREELLAHEVIYQADERLLVGAKDDVRRAIGRSPDLGDAAAMAAWPAAPEAPGKKKRKARWV